MKLYGLFPRDQTMKIEVLSVFFDKNTDKRYNVGDVIEIEEEDRIATIMANKFGKPYEEPAKEPKKRSRKTKEE